MSAPTRTACVITAADGLKILLTTASDEPKALLCVTWLSSADVPQHYHTSGADALFGDFVRPRMIRRVQRITLSAQTADRLHESPQQETLDNDFVRLHLK